jgi:hypothetical protein
MFLVTISVFYTIIYIEEKKNHTNNKKKKEKKRNIINILNIFCYILSTLQIFLGMAVLKNFVFLGQHRITVPTSQIQIIKLENVTKTSQPQT